MKHIAVTGGSGRLGIWVTEMLIQRGYEVTIMDEKKPEKPITRSIRLNLNNLGEVYGALQGIDGVIHLAAIPAPVGLSNEIVFGNNVMCTFNILEASAGLGIRRITMASSESIYGFAWAPHTVDPVYVPIDENHALLTEDCYGLSKEINERTAEMFHRRTGMQIVSLRLSTVVTPEFFAEFFADKYTPEKRRKSLWSYIDVRDAASACILALETKGLGAAMMNITDDYTCVDIKTLELMNTWYPHTEIRTNLQDYQAIVSNEKAKKLLNWQPQFSWRKGLV